MISLSTNMEVLKVQTNFRTLDLAVELHKACKKIQVKAYIKDQLERASLSVALNLAEGSAKPSAPDQRRFYYIAYGSLREVKTLLRLIDQDELYRRADSVGAHVYRLIQSRS